MRKEFDIKYRPQIESGEYKVETKDGRKARIISWNKNGFECTEIVVLVTCATGTENCNIYTDKGLLRSNPCQENMKLCIVTPEPELSEFEKRLVKFYNDRNGLPYDKDGVYNRHDLDELLHNTAAELLAIAREELTPKFGKEYEDGYLDGLNHGKAEALKGTPVWRKATAGTRLPGDSVIRAKGEEPRFGCVAIRDCEYITVNDLNRLTSDERPTETSDKA